MASKLLAAVLIFSVVAQAHAATYTFQKLYDQHDGVIVNVAVPPSLNDQGVAAFLAQIGGTGAIVKGSGGPLTTIAAQGAYSTFGSYTGINNVGRVMFVANDAGGLPGIFTGDGGAVTNINKTLTGNFTIDLGIPAINDSGMVVFKAFDSNNFGLFMGNGGAPSVVQMQSVGGGSADINNAGAISYVGISDIRRWANGISTVINNEQGQFKFLFGSPGINSAGQVLYVGFASQVQGNQTLMAVGDGTSNNIIAGPPSYSSINAEVDFNDQGVAVFRGQGPSGFGLYAGTGPSFDPVLYQGMPLLGSTLSSFAFYRHGLNNVGQIAFRYSLDNGDSGIAIATPVPEPSTFAMLALGAIFLRGARRRGN